MLSSKAGGCTAAVSFGNRTPREHSKEALQLAAFFLFTTSPIGTLRTRWAKEENYRRVKMGGALGALILQETIAVTASFFSAAEPCQPTRFPAMTGHQVNFERAASGTKRTSRVGPTTSVDRGRPEVVGGQSERRN
jgi:hypothetical protein